MSDEEVIDLTLDSPGPSPVVVRRQSRAATASTQRIENYDMPQIEQDTQPGLPTTSNSNHSSEWEDLSFMDRSKRRKKQPRHSPVFDELPSQPALDPDDPEWRPTQDNPVNGAGGTSQNRRTKAVRAPAGETGGAEEEQQQQAGGRRKPKRTREQIAADAAERKAAKAREAALRKEQKEYDSDKHVLKYLTTILDPSLMTTPLGLKIAEAFQATHSRAEHERIAYKVEPIGLIHGYSGIRWTRKIPVFSNDDGLDDDESQLQQVAGFEFEEQDEPHIMVCFEAESFVNSVVRDKLESLWSQLGRKFSGHRVHLLVNRLDAYLTQRERNDFKQDMRLLDGTHGFRRGPIDTFVSSLAVYRPGVTFRDVSVVDQGAQHVCLITTAIAKSIIRKTDAEMYLLAKGKKDSTAAAALLATNPIEESSTLTFMQSLCALPSVGPQVAHSIATRFKSLGVLGTYVVSNRKSITEKQKELENMTRAGGGARVSRVGPKAAKTLVELLLSEDPDTLVHAD